MKALHIVRVDSNDGDAHYVFIDVQPSGKNTFAQDYDEIEAKKASKKEAPKPLILNRAE